MSPSLTLAPTGPPSPMASCVGGGRPPQHNVSATCRLRSQVQMCNETNMGEGFCLGESEDGNCPAGVTSLVLGRNDVWREGRLALRPGFFPRGDGDVSQRPKTCQVLRSIQIKIVKSRLNIELL